MYVHSIYHYNLYGKDRCNRILVIQDKDLLVFCNVYRLINQEYSLCGFQGWMFVHNYFYKYNFLFLHLPRVHVEKNKSFHCNPSISHVCFIGRSRNI